MTNIEMLINLADLTIDYLWKAGRRCDEYNNAFAFDRAVNQLNIDVDLWSDATWDLYNQVEADRILLARVCETR